MISSLGGAAAGVKPDPRYLIPYDNPIATPYPAAVVSPGGPVITTEPAKKAVDNGTLSGDERKARPKGNRRDPTKHFERSDRNKDGFVTLEEFIGDPMNRNVPALTKQFKKRDANNDHRLTLEEMKG